MSKDVVLILSGGLDSSTLLYKLLNEGNKVTALSFNYGQKAAIEIPSRNTILLELATAFAISNNKEEVYYGAIKADVGDYPDTTPEFLEKINELNKVNNYEYIPVCAPFIDTDKKDVVKLALKLGVPIEKTWSCYVNNDGTPCGECFSCKSRIKAIEEAKKELGID